MRRVEPAYPDLIPLTHLVRPGYLPGPRVALDPIRMGVVWEDAPQRSLPAEGSVPRDPVRAIVFARVARERDDVLLRLLERGSSALLVLDDPAITPANLGLDGADDDARITALLPVLPFPLSEGLRTPSEWKGFRWGAALGLFPFPGAADERRVEQSLLSSLLTRLYGAFFDESGDCRRGCFGSHGAQPGAWWVAKKQTMRRSAPPIPR